MRVGILTSGGDAPGMNAVLVELVSLLERAGHEVIGIKRGFNGFFHQEYMLLTSDQLRHLYKLGGSMLLSGRNEQLYSAAGRQQVLAEMEQIALDVVVVIGGNGSIQAARRLAQQGGHIVAIPASIDNDIAASDYSIGFDTCVNVVTESLDRIRDTAISHDRVHVVEVMGRKGGQIALHGGRAAFAEYILLPGMTYDLPQLCAAIKQRRAAGKWDQLVVVAEGYGSAHEVSHQLTEMSGVKTTVTVLGQIQRGGAPTACERMMARQFAAQAASAIHNHEYQVMIARQAGKCITYPLELVSEQQKWLDPALLPFPPVSLSQG